MSSLGRRLILYVGFTAIGVFGAVGSAAAKGLPVTSVRVSTSQPQAGQSVDVVVRFGRGFDLGDQYGWAGDEIVVFPTARTDGNGWPLDRNDPGVPVQLHRVTKGVYRGAFTVADPGEYVVISRSAFYSHEDPALGGAIAQDYPVPLRLHVARATDAVAAPSGSGSGSEGISMITVGVLTASVVAVVTVVAMSWRRRRGSRQRPDEAVSSPGEEHVLVGDGPYRR